MWSAFIFSLYMGWRSVRRERKKQGVAVKWQCPVAIIKKVKAALTNNKRVPCAAWLQIQVSRHLKAEGF